MLIDNLKKMSLDELKAFAASQGIHHHHAAGIEKIMQAIVDQLGQPQVNDIVDPRKLAPKEPVWNTKEQVEAAIAPIRDKNPAFEAIYDDVDRTVTFRCKGAEDCLNMSVPLHWLRQKAQVVSRGRMALMGLNQHFDQLNASGANAYTNTVLA